MRLTGLVSKCAFKDWQCVANAVDRLALREPIDAYAQTIAGALNLKLDADIRGVALPAGSGWDYGCVLGGHGS
jgi:hypothetical protein